MKKRFNIIAISRKTLKWSLVTANKIVDEKQMPWDIENPESLEKTKQELIKLLKEKEVRLLLEEDSYYLIRLPYEKKLTRQEIYQLISSRIPEDFNSILWDFYIEKESQTKENVPQEKNKKKTKKKVNDIEEIVNPDQVLVFVPVKEVVNELINFLTEQQIIVEAMEPIQVAKKRDSDPVMGLALKEDLEGKDDETLNISTREIKVENEKVKTKDIVENKEKGLFKKVLKSDILKIILFFILIGLSVLILVNYQKKVSNKEKSYEKISDLKEEMVSQPERVSEIADLSILILVEKTPSEEAERVKEILASLGMKNIDLEETDETIEESVILLREDVEEELLEMTLEQLNTLEIAISEEKLGNNVENHIVLFIKE